MPIDTPEIRAVKKAARIKTVNSITSGVLTRQACEVCGNQKTDAHHEDYLKPLEIRWLCRQCHALAHKQAGTGPGGRREGSGRKPGIRMRCGECMTPLTACEWRKHFTECPKRPK